MATQRKPRQPASESGTLAIRRVRLEDLPGVIALDELNTGMAKPEYWRDLFDRYTQVRRPRYFLVAESAQKIIGFIIGEVRTWEFGSPPCGWVFAIGVDPGTRVQGVGSQLLDAVCAHFKQAGVEKLRTMLARDNTLLMSFFRSQGMMAGPFIELEKDI
jgi:ribosomal protein S18 acetylase RimI-like enzyme